MMMNNNLCRMDLIGKNLKRMRLAKGLTVKEIAEYLFLDTVQAVYKYEAGKSLPPPEKLLALMMLYDVKADELISDAA